jgi:succinoglycan biosynthesis protein ExoM
MNTSPSINDQITVAVCCYNAGHYLPDLIEKLTSQDCPIPFEVLIIDNNSTDNTQEQVSKFAANSTIPIRYVQEFEQGIVFARNRAVEESLSSRYLAFIDADEIPKKGWLQSAVKTLSDETIDCVGGKVSINLPYRPSWLSDDLLPFYAELNYSNQKFRIIDSSTPIWTANIAYNTRIFQQGLRFDTRYNRKGKGIGGGEDSIMFRYFLQNHFNLVYEPEMEILHLIPDEKIKRRYFLKLHYLAGIKAGLYEINYDGKKIFGIPGFMFVHLLKKTYQVLYLCLVKPHAYMREAMNLTYQLGMMNGCFKKHAIK